MSRIGGLGSVTNGVMDEVPGLLPLDRVVVRGACAHGPARGFLTRPYVFEMEQVARLGAHLNSAATERRDQQFTNDMNPRRELWNQP